MCIYAFAMLYFKNKLFLIHSFVWNKVNLLILMTSKLWNQCVSVCAWRCSTFRPCQNFKGNVQHVQLKSLRFCPVLLFSFDSWFMIFDYFYFFLDLGLWCSRYLLSLPAVLVFDVLLDLPQLWKTNVMLCVSNQQGIAIETICNVTVFSDVCWSIYSVFSGTSRILKVGFIMLGVCYTVSCEETNMKNRPKSVLVLCKFYSPSQMSNWLHFVSQDHIVFLALTTKTSLRGPDIVSHICLMFCVLKAWSESRHDHLQASAGVLITLHQTDAAYLILSCVTFSHWTFSPSHGEKGELCGAGSVRG